MNIRSLAKQGYSLRQIARMTGLHRKTVKKYLREGQLPVYTQTARVSLLEPYKSLIEGWLSQQDYQASRVHELLTLQGYSGSYETVKRYVRSIKEKRDRKAYVRFETTPGRQAQVDFGDFQISGSDGSTETVYCFIMVLGYSRHMHIEFVPRCTMVNFLTCHQHAFGSFGGVPAEIVYDNMKNVVVKRLVGRTHWNPVFSGFVMHYGFQPLAAPPYSPWVKGKVERPYHYLRERFWRGYVFKDIAQANRDVSLWNRSVAAERMHGTTREKVMDRFNKERSCLGHLPGRPYDVSEKVSRHVQKDCQIAFGGNRYVVPHELVGKKVLLKIKDGILRVCDDDRMATIYRIPSEKGQTLAHPHLYERLKADEAQRHHKYRTPSGKAKATRGLLKEGLPFEVMQRSVSVYEVLTQEAAHV